MVAHRTSYMQIRYECSHGHCINETEIVRIIGVTPEGFFDMPNMRCAFCQCEPQIMSMEMVVP